MDELEKQAQEAIAAGADPRAVNARLESLRAQQSQSMSPNVSHETNMPPEMPNMEDITPEQASSGFANLGLGLKDAGARSLATVANVGRNILNAPHNVAPSVFGALVDPKFDYYEALGTKQGLPDEIVQTALEYAPFGAGAAKTVTAIPGMAKGFKNILASSVLGNAAYGAAANPEDRAKGAAVGGAIGAGAPLFGKGVDKLIVEPAAKFVAQQSVKPLVKKALPFIKNAANPQQAAKEFNAVYKSKAAESNKLWGETEKIASKLDGSRSLAFDALPYTKYLDDFEKSYSAKTPAQAAKFESAAQLVDEIKRLKPQNIQDLVALRQNLNQTLSSFSKTKNIAENAESKNIIKGIKNTFDEIINKNVPKNSAEAQAFKKTWADANKSTQDLKAFYDAPSKMGIKKTRQEMQALLKEGGESADGAIFDLFDPASGQTGVGGFEHLSKLVGKPKAQEYLKGYMMRNVEKGNAIDALKVYQKLSPEQRSAIFKGSKEGKLLENASHVWREIGKDEERFFSHMPWLHGLSAGGIPALAAGGAAFASGEPFEKSLGIGLATGAAALAAGKGVASLAPTFPSIARGATRLAAEGRKKPGNFLALALQTEFNKENNE